MREHIYKPNKLLLRDIKEYGWGTFNKEVLLYGEESYCYTLEDPIINLYNAYYNSAKGGKHPGGSVGEKHPFAHLTEDNIYNIRYKYKVKNITQKCLAVEFNTTNKNISKIIRGERWGHVHSDLISINNNKNKVSNRSKLSEQDVLDIRIEYSLGGITIKEIAEIYNIARQNISKILDGISWNTYKGPIRGIDYPARRNNNGG
jgi:plasmid maintenance system antidote protein VapI